MPSSGTLLKESKDMVSVTIKLLFEGLVYPSSLKPGQALEHQEEDPLCSERHEIPTEMMQQNVNDSPSHLKRW
jgi:hypothetical protein